MARRAFNAKNTNPVGPYSHAAEADGLFFFSGQIGLDGKTGKLVTGGVAAETEQCFRNIKAVLETAGLTEENVVKVTVFLADMGNFQEMNSIYEKAFSAPYPARSTIGVASLPLGAQVEIELIALK
ncbi:MAG TPA: Rid family detoxifying hydrolase [Spirochaetota bacterium]|nr:Rid family detoxifying hydrolase [Spirochaetota bacterium]